jgi:hypothetical protein
LGPALGAAQGTPPSQGTPPQEEQRAPAEDDRERPGLLQGKLESLEEQYAETKTDVLSMKKLKLSGYVQGRLQHSEASLDGVKYSDGSAQVKDGFTVRRGRLKATYEATWSRYVLQIDATGKGVALKDAEAHLIEPWTGQKLTLVLGQTKWPFGYEVLQSSSDREFPERTNVIRAFFPGERDRGAKILGKVKFVNFQVGAFDGNGTDNKGFLGLDNDRNKDAVGRLGIDLGWIAAGASGWWGETFKPGDFSGATPVYGKTYDRTRVGGDIQLYLDLLPIGGTALKGEYVAGRTYAKSGVEQFDVPASGWWAVLVQNLGVSNAIAIRYDRWDPLNGTDAKEDSKDPKKPASSNVVETWGVALIHYWDDVLKISAVYELPMTETTGEAKDPEDNIFTLQMQAKF